MSWRENAGEMHKEISTRLLVRQEAPPTVPTLHRTARPNPAATFRGTVGPADIDGAGSASALRVGRDSERDLLADREAEERIGDIVLVEEMVLTRAVADEAERAGIVPSDHGSLMRAFHEGRYLLLALVPSGFSSGRAAREYLGIVRCESKPSMLIRASRARIPLMAA